MSFDHLQCHLQKIAQPHGLEVVAVRWEDCQRYVTHHGGNISDVRLVDRQHRPLWTLRAHNVNEKIGICRAQDIAMVVGNQSPASEKQLRCITLREYLQNFGLYAQYMGVEPTTDLFSPLVDEEVSVRFQSVFLPADSEFATSIFNDGTTSDRDPQNILLLCTAQGTSVAQSRTTDVKMLMHMNHGDDAVSQHWLQAQDEIQSTLPTQSLPMFMGPKAMGRRMNVVMNIQLPLRQRPARPRLPTVFDLNHDVFRSVSETRGARVDVGDEAVEAIRPKLEENKWQRHPNQHITVTLTAYYTLQGNSEQPSPVDVTMAIQEMQDLYSRFPLRGQLLQDPHLLTKKITLLHPSVPFRPLVQSNFPEME